VRAELPAKLTLFAALTVGICLPYFTLQQLDLFPERTVPILPLDRRVSFDPRWTGIYLSICLLVPLFPLFATRRDDVWRFGRGLLALCLPAFACFLFFPVRGPRPEGIAFDGAYAWLVSVDGARNAFPSLHIALTVFALLYGFRILAEGASARRRRVLAGLGLTWGLAIAWSTLATRQHWTLDVLAALPLAGFAYHVAFRGAEAPRIGAAHR
jgi:membrane-associated phospholipid phosphatase